MDDFHQINIVSDMSDAPLSKTLLAEMHRKVIEAACNAIEVREVDGEKSLLDNGGDSLGVVRFMVELAQFGDVNTLLDISDRDLTLREIADCLARAAMFQPLETVDDQFSASERNVVKSLPNRGSYFLKRRRSLFEWVFVSHFLETRRGLARADVVAWLKNLLGDFDGLRVRLHSANGRWNEYVEPDQPEDYLAWMELDRPCDAEELQKVAETAVRSALASFAERKPLFRLSGIATADGRTLIVVVHHHLVVDGLAKQYIIKRLLGFLGGAALMPPNGVRQKVSSFRSYVDDYYRHFTAFHERYLPFWRNQPWQELEKCVVGSSDGGEANRESATAQCIAAVDLGIYGIGLNRQAQAELLLAAIGLAFREWRSCRYLHLAYVTHSRTIPGSQASYLQTVGWLSETVDFLLELEGDEDDLVECSREWLRHRIDYGRALAFMRHCHPDPRVRQEVDAYPEPVISFNFAIESTMSLSLPEGVSRLTQPHVSAPVPTDAERVFLLSGGAWREKDRLIVAWDFSSKIFAKEDVAAFTESCAKRMQSLIDRRMRMSSS